MARQTQIRGNTITIPSDPILICEVDEFVESRLRERSVEDTIIADIAICATEVVNNGIYHGNRQDPNKTVTLEMKFSPDEVVILVTDQGDNSFNPAEVRDPIADENLLREVGRGIFIVRHLMDKVDIGPAAGGGTVVTLTKKIA
jgi:serine/threonine-protein kinase RsbW